MIPFYPDLPVSRRIAEALTEAGVSYLELQFPFSDPSADGPVIQAACTAALENGFTVDQGFSFTKEVSADCGIPVFIMTYAALVFARGVERFVAEALNSGVRGIIIPDLPADSDEGLLEAGKAAGLAVVPVLVPGMSPVREELYRSLEIEYCYAALRRGITGSHTELSEENMSFLRGLSGGGRKVLAGFGVDSREQVELLMPLVHAVVVGSAFMRISGTAAERGTEAMLDSMQNFARKLVSNSESN
jgi:tryptophan synthase alpha chain